MGIHKAYWINPEGEVWDIGNSTHIMEIIHNPGKFLISKDEIISLYNQHNEKLGIEGKAREVIIHKVLKSGFIRIRLVPNQYWSISANAWDKQTKLALSKWAIIAKDIPVSGPYMPVNIATFEEKLSGIIVEELI
ncbi:MAG: hypothetical protein HQL46_16765 [Gammaproteobacteria bacterium]|nr:hypothetical protein [Gammaproteobacteria bacterium]